MITRAERESLREMIRRSAEQPCPACGSPYRMWAIPLRRWHCNRCDDGGHDEPPAMPISTRRIKSGAMI